MNTRVVIAWRENCGETDGRKCRKTVKRALRRVAERLRGAGRGSRYLWMSRRVHRGLRLWSDAMTGVAAVRYAAPDDVQAATARLLDSLEG